MVIAIKEKESKVKVNIRGIVLSKLRQVEVELDKSLDASKEIFAMNDRKLCSAEQGMEILNRYSGTFNVATVGRILGLLTEETVRLALDYIQNRHPRLNSRIVGDLDNLRFETGAKKIPLRVVDKQREGQWQEILLQELNAQIKSSEVLLRAVLVRPETEESAGHLILTMHHAITDGLSSIRLHSELLTYCQKIASGELNAPETSKLRALPPVDELLPASTKGLKGKLDSTLFLLRLKLKQLWYRPETLNFEKTVPIEQRSCGIVCRQLDADFTQKLINLCRQENTTVQGALGAAMMLAVAKKIKSGQKTRVFCRTYVDLRKRLKPAISDENLGILVSSLTSFHSTNSSFWELARDLRQQLEVGLNRSDVFSPVLIIRKIVELALNQSDRAVVTVAITNIGQVNIPRVYGQFELSEISFVPSVTAFGGIFTAAVTTFDGKMFLNFPFSKPALSNKTMETLADSALSYLVDAAKGNMP
ncbi:MAG: condensation domain-containing protein [Cyanobacteriota bacterium]|nr:condensation domain-containing protein [Cyanobacteriota bacterium]